MPGPVTENRTQKPYGSGSKKPRSPLWRLRIWQLLLLIGALAVAGRLYYMQILRGEDYTQKATVQRQKNRQLVHRGSITDRHGLPLAVDTTRYDIYVHPDLLKTDREKAVNTLASITHTDPSKLADLFAKGYPVITVARHLGREEADQLHALNWTGVDVVPQSFRHYPEGKLAAHVLGYVNMDTQGQGGVEQAEEGMLKDTGTVGKPQLDGRGRPILTSGTEEIMAITPPLGRQVELTVDNYLQHLAEKELAAMAIHSRAVRGTAIVADPKTGEILAWANYPSYNPNQYTRYPYATTKNWSMVDVYQPGSTFKVLTIASALDTGAINPRSTFYDSGSIKVGNRILHNHDGGHGHIDLLNLFIHSSNVASAMVALKMKPDEYYKKLRDFGIGRKTGIDLAGESQGLLLHPEKWRPIDQATTGFGQGAVAVTPLQLVAAVSAIANKGTWTQPHVIRRVYDPRTGVTEEWTEPKRRRAVKPEVAELVSHLLAENISRGSQVAGKVPGYRVAGKTGTAQKVREGGRGYMAGQTIASFIGYLPEEDPQLLCLVVVDGPQTDGRWGNTVAGPVFNAICEEAARYLSITPSRPNELDPKGRSRKRWVAPSIKYAAEIKAREAISDG